MDDHPTVFIALAAVAQALIYRSQSGILRKSADAAAASAAAAAGSVGAARQAFIASHRPKLRPRFISIGDTSFAVGREISGELHIFNTGETGAVLKRCLFEIFIGPRLPTVAPYQGKDGVALDVEILPRKSSPLRYPTDGPRVVSSAEMLPLRNHSQRAKNEHREVPGGANVFLIGWLRYADEAAQVRTAGFCTATISMPIALIGCPTRITNTETKGEVRSLLRCARAPYLAARVTGAGRSRSRNAGLLTMPRTMEDQR